MYIQKLSDEEIKSVIKDAYLEVYNQNVEFSNFERYENEIVANICSGFKDDSYIVTILRVKDFTIACGDKDLCACVNKKWIKFMVNKFVEYKQDLLDRICPQEKNYVEELIR